MGWIIHHYSSSAPVEPLEKKNFISWSMKWNSSVQASKKQVFSMLSFLLLKEINKLKLDETEKVHHA